jgi:hypothetical protein
LSNRYCYLPLYILSENCSTCFGCHHHPSSGAQTTLSTASGIFHTVTAICRYIFYLKTALHVSGVTTTHHQERKQLYLQHMVFVKTLLLLAAIYFIWKLLYMFRVVPPFIIRSANNCIYSIWYLSDRYCYLPLYILSGNCSTYFGWYHKSSSGAQTTVSTASRICQTVTATCRYIFYLETALHVSGGTTIHHQERKQLYLQHLVFVRP